MRTTLLIVGFLASLSLRADADTPVATILCYHEVDDDATHDTIPRRTASDSGENERLRYTASVENFTAQLDYLEANGYNVIPLAELVAFLKGKIASIPPKAVVITVDDGWSCAYDHIYPELRKRGMPWSLFIYPKIVGRGMHAVTWSEVAALARDGVDVESHSYSHPFLTEMTSDGLCHELIDSREILQKKTNNDVRFFCYPFGAFNDTIVAELRSCGYAAALTTNRGPITRSSDPMKLERYLIHDDTTLDEFKTFLPQDSAGATLE